jgi:hypothetical protein
VDERQPYVSGGRARTAECSCPRKCPWVPKTTGWQVRLPNWLVGLKDRLWVQWFPELERAILEKYGANIAARAEASLFLGQQHPNTYAVTIDPSSRGRGRDLSLG